METIESGIPPVLAGLAHFAAAPFRVRTYTNLLFLSLAFPLGLAYFLFLTVGLSVGLGLSIVWIGLPILALVFFGSWGFSAFERQMAIHLLGAPVPPSGPSHAIDEVAPRKLTQRLGDFFANPVTWKGIFYLALKFPLGIVSFVALVATLATSAAFILAPFAWTFGSTDLELDVPNWFFDSAIGVWTLLPIGLAFLLVALNALNFLAWIWKTLAVIFLGSERFRAGQPPLGSLPPAPLDPPSSNGGSATPDFDAALPA